jgi:hypothetical protein
MRRSEKDARRRRRGDFRPHRAYAWRPTAESLRDLLSRARFRARHCRRGYLHERVPKSSRSDCGLGGFRGTAPRTPFSRCLGLADRRERDLARAEPAFPFSPARTLPTARKEVVIATSREEPRRARPRGGSTRARIDAGRASATD